MKKVIYLICILCAVCSLCACEIDDECLDDAIRRKFEQERNSSSGSNGSIDKPDRNYDANCKVSLGESAFLQRECAVKINLAGKSVGYKYYFSSSSYSEQQIRRAMESLKFIEGEEYNFVVKDYYPSYGGSVDLYLYVVGYDDKRNFGPIVEEHFEVTNRWGYANPSVAVEGIVKKGNELSWNFRPSYVNSSMDISFCILTDEEADYAANLSDAALAVYIQFFTEYTTVVENKVKQMTFKLNDNPKSVMIVSKVSSPLVIKKLYKSF